MNQGDFVRITNLGSDHWTPNEHGHYPQPRIEQEFIDLGYQIRKSSKQTVHATEVPEVLGQIGQISHVVTFENEEGQDSEPTYMVRFTPDLHEQCLNDWFQFRASDMEVVQLSEEEQFDFLAEWF